MTGCARDSTVWWRVRDDRHCFRASRQVSHLATQQSVYVEISRARGRAERATDDATEFRARSRSVTGERIAALDTAKGEKSKTIAEMAADGSRAKQTPKTVGRARKSERSTLRGRRARTGLVGSDVRHGSSVFAPSQVLDISPVDAWIAGNSPCRFERRARGLFRGLAFQQVVMRTAVYVDGCTCYVPANSCGYGSSGAVLCRP